MENENGRRGVKILKILGILLAIAGICFVVVKLYKKFFCKEQPVLEAEAEDVEAIAAEAAAPEEAAEEVTFVVPAEAVLANAEQLEA